MTLSNRCIYILRVKRVRNLIMQDLHWAWWSLRFFLASKLQCKNFYKISSFNVCFQKIFSPKTIIGEASNCDQSIPHPFLGIHPNVLSSSTRLCGLWKWGFALRWWSRRGEINRLCYNQFRPITPQVGFLVCPSTWLHTR